MIIQISVEVYQKKQEFGGGLGEFNKLECKSGNIFTDKNSLLLKKEEKFVSFRSEKSTE